MSNAFKWGTVTGVGPLRVRLDGDTEALPFTPDSLLDPQGLGVGDRVRCELSSRRVIILGRSQGPRSMRKSFPTKAALDAFTGWAGLVGYVEADSSEYRWVSGWKLWARGATPFVPEWSAASGFTLGNGTVQGSYSISGGLCSASVTLTLGTSTSWSGILSFAAPVPASSSAINSSVSFVDASAGGSGRFVGELLMTSPTSNMFVELFTDAGTRMVHVTGMGAPFVWAVSDELRISVTYPV